jgi:plastocyanin
MNTRFFMMFALTIALTFAGAQGSIAAANDSSPASPAAKPTSAHAQTANVSIENFTFSPDTLTVHLGTKVTWTNHDDIPHLVVITKLKQKSAALDTDDTYTYAFTKPGKYQYYCGMHPRMVGQINVVK